MASSSSVLPGGGFEDVEGPALCVESTWKKGNTGISVDAQTKPIKVKDDTTQTRDKQEKETQTDAAGTSTKSEEAQGELLASLQDLPTRLQQFLRDTAGPVMLRELDLSQTSRAFEDYGYGGNSNSDGNNNNGGGLLGDQASEGATLKYTLTVDLRRYIRGLGGGGEEGGGAGLGVNGGLVVTGVSWNASGSLVAVSYGRYDVSGWCESPGAVCVWSVFKRAFNPEVPDFIYDHSSCLMSVACHPEKPSLIAAGSFNGEVLLLDVTSGGGLGATTTTTKGGASGEGQQQQQQQQGEALVACSAIDDYFHREPVVKLCWVWDLGEEAYQLASISGDGKVLFWSLAQQPQQQQQQLLQCPVQGCRITATAPSNKNKSAAGTSRGSSSKGGAGSKVVVVGGSALSFPMEGRVKASMVVGSEGGAVLRCLLPLKSKNSTSSSSKEGSGSDGSSSSKWTAEAEEAMLRVPEAQRMEVKRHVESKMRELKIRQVTLSAVYESKPDPCLLFPCPDTVALERHDGPVHCLDCSPFHRNLFVSCGADGQARIYSVLQARPLLRLEPFHSQGGGGGGYLYSAVWSKTRPLVLATASDNGHIAIYDLGQSQQLPVVELELPPTNSNKSQQQQPGPPPCYALAFNPRLRDFLASGDGAGRVQLWQLSWRLANLQPSEHQDLQRLAQDTTTTTSSSSR